MGQNSGRAGQLLDRQDSAGQGSCGTERTVMGQRQDRWDRQDSCELGQNSCETDRTVV